MILIIEKMFFQKPEKPANIQIFIYKIEKNSISSSAITSANILFFHRLALDIYAEL